MAIDPYAHGYVIDRMQWTKTPTQSYTSCRLKRLVSRPMNFTESASTHATVSIRNDYTHSQGENIKRRLWPLFMLFQRPFINLQGTCSNQAPNPTNPGTTFSAQYGNKVAAFNIQGSNPDCESVLEKLIQ